MGRTTPGMVMLHPSFVLATCLLLLGPAINCSADVPITGKLRVSVYQGAGTPLGGFSRDILEVVARENGWQLSFGEDAGTRPLSALDDGSVDLVLNVPGFQVEKSGHLFTENSLFDNWTELFTAPGSALDSPVELQGKRIGVVDDSPQVPALRDILDEFHIDAEIAAYATPTEVAEAVNAGGVDAAALDRSFLLHGARAWNLENMSYSSNPYGLRLVASDDAMSHVITAVDDYLAAGRRDGSSSYYAVFDKWFPVDRSYHPPGYFYWLLASILACMLAFAAGRFLLRPGTAGRIAELEERARRLELEAVENDGTQRQLHQLAYYDEITSLPNRLMFSEKLHAAMIDARGDVCVTVIDLDRFKSFNYTLGHETGNALLRLVARRIAGALPKDAFLARYGGDEFSVLLRDRDPAACCDVAARVVQSLQDPFTELDGEIYVTASVGLGHYPTDAANIPELFQQADIAMYRAKVEGGDTYCLYDSEVGDSIVSRMELETSMRRALVKGEMWLEYQPQVDLETNRILAVEALLRWRHPERGMMDTSEFIRVAEETGQIITIGEWVMEEVFAQAAQWREQGIEPFKIAINLSSKQVQKRDFVAFVRQLIEEYDFPPEILELEITEHMLIENERQTRKTMNELKELGMSLAIDDFGTGYSALSYLHRFPIDTLKIDKSFVASLHSNDNNKAITSAIVAMAERLDLRTVAECVEKQEQVAILGEMQCRAAQGFYFAEPLTQEKLADWMGARLNQGARSDAGTNT